MNGEGRVSRIGTAEPDRPSGERERVIPRAVESLNRLVSEQRDVVNRLEQRLAAVLRPLTAAPTTVAAVEKNVSPATLELVGIAGLLQENSERLRIIERALDL